MAGGPKQTSCVPVSFPAGRGPQAEGRAWHDLNGRDEVFTAGPWAVPVPGYSPHGSHSDILGNMQAGACNRRGP